MLSVFLENGYLTQTMKNCDPYIGEGQGAKFESLFTVVRYIFYAAQLKKG